MVSYSFYESDYRVRRYAEALAEEGHEVSALVIGRPGQNAHTVIKQVQVHRVQFRARDEHGPLSHLKKLLRFFLRTAWLLSRNHLAKPYDIIHVHSVPDFEVFAALVPKLMGASVVLDIHDIVPELYAGKFRVSENSTIFWMLLLVERLAAGFADHVIISNHLWKDRLVARAVPTSKCTAIINYPDSRIFVARNRSRDNDGQFVLLYPGTLNRHQGLDIAIEAVAMLRERLPGLRLRIVGDGPQRDALQALLECKDLRSFVSISDPVPLENVAKMMSEADAGIVPKRADGFGDQAFSTKIMEFMATGVPVVASRTTVDQHYFDESMIQFFEPGNAEDLAAKILDLAEGSAVRDRLRTAGDHFIKENCWEVKKEIYFDLLRRLTGKPVTRRAPGLPIAGGVDIAGVS